MEYEDHILTFMLHAELFSRISGMNEIAITMAHLAKTNHKHHQTGPDVESTRQKEKGEIQKHLEKRHRGQHQTAPSGYFVSIQRSELKSERIATFRES